MIFLENIYTETLEEGRITRIEPRTIPFYNFNLNLGGALIIPTLVYGPDSDDDYSFRDSLLLHGLAITQIITSLETYYTDIFSILTDSIKTSQINSKILSDFIKKTRLSNEFVHAIGENNNLEFPLSAFIPKYFPLQEKDRIKTSFRLIGLNPNIYMQEWNRTFGGKENSTVKRRHAFIHGGVDFTHLSIPIDTVSDIKNRIKDAIVLVYCIEKQLHDQNKIQKNKKLYPKLLSHQ